jgi:predicted membrane-bound dolichyl-phosphate-mannose-protein mannosyltransferase
MPRQDLSRRSAVLWVTAATVLGGVFRFYGLAWGAPYFHFHMDEHLVFQDAYLLARDPHEAAMSAKFFMYSPGPSYLLNLVVRVYQLFAHPLNLTIPRDEITYMVLGRAISATLGTATIPLVYVVAKRVSGRLAGVLAAFLLACAVIHLRDSHFFALDVSMAFCTVLAWCFLTRTVERGTTSATIASGLGLGLGLLCKYSAAFLAPLIGLAELLSPKGPRGVRPAGPWARAVLRATSAVALGIALFLVLNPLVVTYFDKFQSDIKVWVIDPLSGASKPFWIGQFADVNGVTYWFTNLLWWGLGPAFEIWALAGVVWLLVRRDRVAFLAAAFPIAYWLSAGRTATVAPFIRYTVPLAPPLAVAAAAFSADLLRRPRWRQPAMLATTIVIMTTMLYAVAYMNVFRQPDSRLMASRWLLQNVPANAKILVEPSQNTPPMGSYLTAVNFNENYVLFYPQTEKHDYYRLYALDTYRSLYNRGVDDDFRRGYIQSRLALVDWIVMDETYVETYRHLPESEHGVVKQYYRDLFAGRLGFELVKTFKTYPSLFGHAINDDNAEWSFRLFDHPGVYIFRRR